jgi:hypothetical protein
MSAFRPRTTARGGLPNISFVKRKPKPMGTELRCEVRCRWAHGLLLFLKIQEGKDSMHRAPFRNEMGAGALVQCGLVWAPSVRVSGSRGGRAILRVLKCSRN